MLYLENLARKMGIVLSYTMKQLIKFKREKQKTNKQTNKKVEVELEPGHYQWALWGTNQLSPLGKYSHGCKPWQLW
jgi:hypothetical protein